MPEYLILKLQGDDPRNATITAHVQFDGGPEDAIKQGFDGEGRYAIVDWSERLESGLVQGPVEVTDPEDSEVRAKKAEVAQAAVEELAPAPVEAVAPKE